MPRPYQCQRQVCAKCHTERDKIDFFGHNSDSTCLLCHAKDRNFERHRQARLEVTFLSVLGRETRRQQTQRLFHEALGEPSVDLEADYEDDLEADYEDDLEDDDEDAPW